MPSVINNILSSVEISELLKHKVVEFNKEELLNQSSSSSSSLSSLSVKFSIPLRPDIKARLERRLSINLSNAQSLPMRWIKGDTPDHIDKCEDGNFSKTHLIYLTDSIGSLVVDGQSHQIRAGDAHVFSEGLCHSTVDTENTTRLLIGPMSEAGFRVGVPLTPPSINVVNYNPYCEITSNFPIRQALNNGWTARGVIGGMPQKFAGADGGASFAVGRKIYADVVNSVNNTSKASDGRYGPELVAAFQTVPKCCLYTEKSPGNPLIRARSVREVGKPVSGNKSMVASADDYIKRKKNIAIGKGTTPNSLNPNLDLNTQFGFKGTTSQMDANRARRKARGSGYIVPPKCTGRPP